MNGFFPATTKALTRITEMFDFLYPMFAGYWNIRCGITGILKEMPDIAVELINKKFIEGSGIKGVSPHSSAFVRPMEEMHEEFAWIILILLFTIYESWLCDLKNSVFSSLDTEHMGRGDTLLNELTTHTSIKSQIMSYSFTRSYKTGSNISVSNIKSIIICYDLFKKLRNAYVHNGKIANSDTANAYKRYKKEIKSSIDLNANEIPHIYPIKDKKKIQVSLRGVIGFSDILINLIQTIDCMLIGTKVSEKWFNDKITDSDEFKKNLREHNYILTGKIVNKIITECQFHKKSINRTLVSHVNGLMKIAKEKHFNTVIVI